MSARKEGWLADARRTLPVTDSRQPPISNRLFGKFGLSRQRLSLPYLPSRRKEAIGRIIADGIAAGIRQRLCM